jgi:hypothetical protein
MISPGGIPSACATLPFSIAAFPDFIANEAMFAMTSGLASNIISNTPIGLDFRSNSSPSSRIVL